jgi:hypothetical protein
VVESTVDVTSNVVLVEIDECKYSVETSVDNDDEKFDFSLSVSCVVDIDNCEYLSEISVEAEVEL